MPLRPDMVFEGGHPVYQYIPAAKLTTAYAFASNIGQAWREVTGVHMVPTHLLVLGCCSLQEDAVRACLYRCRHENTDT